MQKNGEKRKFEIVAVIDDMEKYGVKNDNMQIIVSHELSNKWMDINSTKYAIHTNKPYEIEKIANEMGVYVINSFAEKLSDISARATLKLAVYTFIIFVTALTIISTGNIISSNIVARKREFAILKSMGMSEKQISKMLFLEGIFYGINSLVFGALTSGVLLYILYLKMVDIKLYSFQIPYANILISIAVTYLAIFIAIRKAKHKSSKKNNSIIEVIRNENI
ncbi:MAG: ABC transporter permease [Clostridia bacterium]|jgi:putative ABC transport system permease protein|nr:ABC transporter permease [Clostridia bacterium]